MFNFSGFNKLLFVDATCPQVLNNLSEEQLDAHGHKNFFANFAIVG